MFVQHGRKDGLGNRFEQLMHLKACCNRAQVSDAVYIWRNSDAPARSYNIHFSCAPIQVISESKMTAEHRRERLFRAEPPLTKEELRRAARSIIPTFRVAFPNCTGTLIGVHVRRGDRIVGSQSAPADFMTVEQSNLCMRKTIELVVARTSSCSVFVCGDDDECVRKMTSTFSEAGLHCVQPDCSDTVDPRYQDFFALSVCAEIYMCSKFSSFAIMAAMVGGAKLHSLYDETQSNLVRYGADVVCADGK